MSDLARFIKGFREFQKTHFHPGNEAFEPLKQGQNPRTMVIGCSDSRVDPALLTGSAPGDIFTVRNVANIVPPYVEDGGAHGVSAAVEFAVTILEVEHIIVLGHSQCGGVKALMEGLCPLTGGFLARWMAIATPALDEIVARLPDESLEVQRQAVEQASILFSLDNLNTFPFVAERVGRGALQLHGWYFDLADGEMMEFDEAAGEFRLLDEAKRGGESV